jgi:tetratricopeptide (TPR) repeat protein
MSELGDVKRKVAEYEAKGDVKKAITELEKAIQEFKKEGSLFNKLGDLYIKVNRQKEALEVYEQGARVFKDETYFPNAIALCKKILRLSKERTEVYGLLGELHKELDQRGEAANYFLEYAERKMKANDLETALKTYNIIKELVPNNPKILETISAIYEKAGKKEEGEVLLKQAHEIENKQGKLRETLVSQAEAAVEEKAEKKIEETTEEEIEEKLEEKVEEPSPKDIPLEEFVSPEVAELLKDEESSEKEVVTEEPIEELSAIRKTIELGELYLNLGSEEEAIDCFRSAADEAWQQKEYDQSANLNQRIAELRPFDLKSRQKLVEIAKIKGEKKLQIQSMLDLAESLTRREAKSQARELYKKILEIDPENVTAHEMYAAFEKPKDFIDLGEVLRTELEDERKSESLQTIEGLVSQFRREVFESIGEGDFRSRYDLGVAYKGMELFQEAIEEFEIAAKDKELRLKALEMMGSCFLEQGKTEDTMRVLIAGLKIPGRPKHEYFGLYFLLGQCYESQNKLKEALQAYVNAYKIDKTVPDLTKKINELQAKFKPTVKREAAPAAPKKAVGKKAPPKPVKAGKVKAKKSKITYL